MTFHEFLLDRFFRSDYTESAIFIQDSDCNIIELSQFMEQ
jgi:hypothetical protein